MATEFICKIRASGGDYTTLALWEDQIEANLTSAQVRVYSHSGITGTVADNATVDGDIGSETATVYHATSTHIMVLHDTAAEVFETGEKLKVDVDNYVTVTSDVGSGSGDTVIAVAEIECSDGNAYTAGATIDGFTTDATNYVDVRSVGTYKHLGVWPTSGNIGRFEIADASGIIVADHNVKLRGLAIRLTGTTDNVICAGNITAIANNMEISDCVMVHDSTAGTTLQRCIYVGYNGVSTGMLIKNNICYNSNGYGIFAYCSNSGAHFLNNTTFACPDGNRISASSDIVCINNIIKGGTSANVWRDGSTTMSSTSGYNVIPTGVTIDARFAVGTTHSTGTADDNVANHLVCSTATFQTDGVVIGNIVANTTDSTYGYVTAINSETDLTLATDVFPDGDENFSVYTNIRGDVTFESESGDIDLHLSDSDTVASDEGQNLYSSTPAVTTDIDGNARPAAGAFDIGADQRMYASTGAITLGAIVVSGVANSSSGTKTATGAITLPAITVAAQYIQAPDTLYSNNDVPGAQEGDANPTGLTDTTPRFSAKVYKLAAQVPYVQIQVSAVDDADFSEPLSWDSGWLTLIAPITGNGDRTEDITYGQT